MALKKRHLERLTDRSIDIVVATDRKGTVVYYNDGASRSLGYAPDEVADTFVARLYPNIEEAKRVMGAMRDPELSGKGMIETFQTVLVSKSGEEIPVAMSATILYDEHGEEDGTIGYAKDLREILRKDQLATLGEVAIGLSHEINNPLAVILNQVALLERDVLKLAGDKDSSVEEERLDAVRREVARISEILERLSAMANDEEYATVKYVGPGKMLDLHRAVPIEIDPRIEGCRILVVDDDPGICGSLEEILERSGCRVETAGDGAEALERLASHPFDLMLTDVVMPNMDGHELYVTVKKLYPEMPVLMMTAFHYDRDHVIKRSRVEGLDGVIFKKPVDPDRLRDVIAEQLK